MSKGAKKTIKWVCIVVGLLLIANTLLVKTRSGWNLGVVLPALLGIPIFLYGTGMEAINKWFHTMPGKIIRAVAVGGYVFVIIVFAIFIPMAASAVVPPQQGADAVIVLGAGLRGDQPSQALKNRLDAALVYQLHNPKAVLVVSGGKGQDEQITEAQAMEEYLLSIGAPPQAIIKEEQSTSTQENFVFSKQLLDRRLSQPYNIVYVTNDFHVRRAGMMAEAAGLHAEGLGAPTPFFVKINNYMREAFALLSVHLLGV